MFVNFRAAAGRDDDYDVDDYCDDEPAINYNEIFFTIVLFPFRRTLFPDYLLWWW